MGKTPGDANVAYSCITKVPTRPLNRAEAPRGERRSLLAGGRWCVTRGSPCVVGAAAFHNAFSDCTIAEQIGVAKGKVGVGPG
jgi:hypothetical protein